VPIHAQGRCSSWPARASARTGDLFFAVCQILCGCLRFGLFAQAEPYLVSPVAICVGVNRKVRFPIDQFGFGLLAASPEIHGAVRENSNLHRHVRGLPGEQKVRLILAGLTIVFCSSRPSMLYTKALPEATPPLSILPAVTFWLPGSTPVGLAVMIS